MKKIVKLTESDLARIVKRVIKESDNNSGLEIVNYINDNFTPDGGWDNDKFRDDWENGGLTAYYVNGELAFVYETEFIDDDGKEYDEDELPELNRLVIGPKVYKTLDEMFGKNTWVSVFTDWFTDNSRSKVDEIDYDDFKGIYRDYLKPSSRSDENGFMFYMEELGEFANKLDWEGLDIEGEEMESFVDEIYQIVHNAKQDKNLSEDEISEIEGFAASIVSRLD